jgi:hypothetical protein
MLLVGIEQIGTLHQYRKDAGGKSLDDSPQTFMHKYVITETQTGAGDTDRRTFMSKGIDGKWRKGVPGHGFD